MVGQFLDGVCIVYVCIYIFSNMGQTIIFLKDSGGIQQVYLQALVIWVTILFCPLTSDSWTYLVGMGKKQKIEIFFSWEAKRKRMPHT